VPCVQVVHVRLAPGFEPHISNTCEDLEAHELTGRLRSMDFASAAAALLGSHAGWRDANLDAPPRTLSTEVIATTLRPFTVTIVRTLRTALVLHASGEDVTAAPTDEHDELWYIERSSHEILLLAQPPAGLARELLLGQAVCELLGSDAPAALTPLLAAEPSRAMATLERLRVTPPSQWAVASALGAPGTPCSEEDSAMLQLVPLRPYFAGEIVAIDAASIGRGGEAGTMLYAEVDVSPSHIGRDALVALRVGSNRARIECLPLHVHSFRSDRHTARVPGAADEGAGAGSNAATRGAADVGGGGSGATAGGSGNGAGVDGPSSGELVSAVASVLRRAGVPIGLETQKLLEANLALQKDLTFTKNALEESSIEASRTKRELESAQRSSTCQVCMERKIDCVLNGCGHVLCSQCAAQIDRCPFCRRELDLGTTRLRW